MTSMFDIGTGTSVRSPVRKLLLQQRATTLAGSRLQREFPQWVRDAYVPFHEDPEVSETPYPLSLRRRIQYMSTNLEQMTANLQANQTVRVPHRTSRSNTSHVVKS